MSESEDDSGAGTREVAHRLFAAEFDDADFSYSESDEERAPNYVVTPTGARVNRLFVVGVLTEIEQVNEEVLRARVVDPTGAFVVYAGQYQPDELAFLEAATPPLFVAVTGKARTFEPEDGDRVFTSVRPESISEIDADTRDRWVVQAVEQTLDRIGRMAGAKETGLAGDDLRGALLDQGVPEADAAGVTLALDHYGTTGDYLQALRDLSLDAARVVAGEQDEAGTLSLSPDDGGDDPVPVLAATATDVSDPAATTDADVSDAGGTEPATADAGAESSLDELESEPDDATAAEPEREQPEDDTATGTAETETTTQPATGTAETETTPSTTAESEDAGATADDSPADETSESPTGADDIGQTTTVEADSGDDDIGEFEPEFDLDDDEREEIKDEFGTDFQSGSEVEEPGEAGIETPDPEEMDEAEAAEQGAPAGAADADPAPDSPGAPAGSESPAPDTDAATSDAPTETPETATDTGADETAGTIEAESDEGAVEGDESSDEPAEDVDLEDAVMEVMEELNDGGGADREAVLATVVDRYGADPDAVEDAIQDALMGGRCYEPEDGKLTPI